MTRICAYVEIDSSFSGGDDEQISFILTRTPTLDSRISLNPASGQIIKTGIIGMCIDDNFRKLYNAHNCFANNVASVYT